VRTLIAKFCQSEDAAITVDWTVLSAAAVGMAVAMTAVLTDAISVLSSRLEAQMRTQQISDAFVQFNGSHFEPLLEAGLVTESEAQDLFVLANTMMNQTVLDSLEAGINAINDGTITEAEYAQLVAVASVAYQRNIVDDAVLDHYFGLGGGGV